jgi:flagellar hook-associated protein 3 FlgL
MRASLNQQVYNSLTFVTQASQKLTDAQARASSGKRILRPSDDVPGAGRAMGLRSAINTVEQFANNIQVSKPLMMTTQNALASLVRNVQSVRSIAVAAANPDFSGNAREAYLRQLDDILGQMADVAMTKHLDQYVFSGTATNAPPIQPATGAQPYIYVGNSGTRKVQALSWVSIPQNISGDKVFNFDGSAGANTTDVFTMVTQLKAALQSGDTDEISAQLSNIDANLDNLLGCSARMGSWIQRIESAEDLLSDSKTRMLEMLSDTEDIDLPSAIIELKTQENLYQVSLAVTLRMLELSLASMS